MTTKQVVGAERANIGFEYQNDGLKFCAGVVVPIPDDIAAQLRQIAVEAIAKWGEQSGKEVSGIAHMQLYMSVEA